MTPAEQMLIAAADLNAKVASAKRSGEAVTVPPAAVSELAYLLESCGRSTAQAGAINSTRNPALVEHAHDIARTYLGELPR
ncbi:hypothetical protein [Streptomyces sp. W1SF4]|uniref:hypothetical protein n=1 Tax=Streptomyces sp. W1SF4 TaxID=2305220 RepID=UPI000F6F4031|nr:hypothetical protein [Streptomyces sp. W1SF4]AZM91468.1 hypothetical protein D1J60_25785 [Streptomyces sp. W1SF4]